MRSTEKDGAIGGRILLLPAFGSFGSITIHNTVLLSEYYDVAVVWLDRDDDRRV